MCSWSDSVSSAWAMGYPAVSVALVSELLVYVEWPWSQFLEHGHAWSLVAGAGVRW